MPQLPDLTKLPGRTIKAKVRWTSIVPVMTTVRLLAPTLGASAFPGVLIAHEGNDSEIVTLKLMTHIAEESLRPGTPFELSLMNLVKIADGVFLDQNEAAPLDPVEEDEDA